MKIKDIDYKVLEQKVMAVHCDELLKRYKDGGLTEKRYRWDLISYYALPFVCDVLYKYCDDGHIDTAMQRITNTH